MRRLRRRRATRWSWRLGLVLASVWRRCLGRLVTPSPWISPARPWLARQELRSAARNAQKVLACPGRGSRTRSRQRWRPSRSTPTRVDRIPARLQSLAFAAHGGGEVRGGRHRARWAGRSKTDRRPVVTPIRSDGSTWERGPQPWPMPARRAVPVRTRLSAATPPPAPRRTLPPAAPTAATTPPRRSC